MTDELRTLLLKAYLTSEPLKPCDGLGKPVSDGRTVTITRLLPTGFAGKFPLPYGQQECIWLLDARPNDVHLHFELAGCVLWCPEEE